MTRAVAAAGFVIPGGLAGLGLWLGPALPVAPSAAQIGFLVTAWLADTASGVLILRHHRRHPVGALLWLAGLSAGAALVALAWSGAGLSMGGGLWRPGAWAVQWLWWPALGLLPIAVLLFPDGRLPEGGPAPGGRRGRPGNRWRGLLWWLAVAGGMASLGLAVGGAISGQGPLLGAETQPDPPSSSGAAGLADALARCGWLVAAIGVLGTALGGIAVLFAVRSRYRAAGERAAPVSAAGVDAGAGPVIDTDADTGADAGADAGGGPVVGADYERRQERAQLRCLGAALLVLVLAAAVDAAASLALAWLVQAAVLPAAMAYAILRFGLLDLHVVVNRALVWLVLSAGVVAGYATAVQAGWALVGAEGGRWAGLAATALLALAFEPARRLVQRAVDRLVYGRRSEPYSVLAELGRRIAESSEPGAALHQLVAELTGQLLLPYACVEVWDRDRQPVLRAAAGRRLVPPERWPLVAHGSDVGQLLVSPRRVGEQFTAAERRLLAAVARSAGSAAHGYLLTLDLRRARARLVLAQAEERRRLRAELHDGLGPALSGIRLQLAALRRDGVSPPVSDALAILDRDLGGASDEVRRIVAGLRPAALDRGLSRALAAEAERWRRPGFAVQLDCPADLGPVPAAVEVATFRIVAEALANAARHSGAATCLVTVQKLDGGPPALAVSIVDDGCGLADRPSATPAVPTRDKPTGDKPTSDKPTGDEPLGGVGLGSIQHRAEELGGQAVVVSAADAGTEVRAVLPLSGALDLREHQPQ